MRIALTVLSITALWLAALAIAMVATQSGDCIKSGCGDEMDRNSVIAFAIGLIGLSGHLLWYISRARRRRV